MLTAISYVPRNRRRKPAALEVYEQRYNARAAYFTACAFVAVGVYDTRPAPTLAEAKAIAATMGRALVYAVTPEGYSICVKAVEPGR